MLHGFMWKLLGDLECLVVQSREEELANEEARGRESEGKWEIRLDGFQTQQDRE